MEKWLPFRFNYLIEIDLQPAAWHDNDDYDTVRRGMVRRIEQFCVSIAYLWKFLEALLPVCLTRADQLVDRRLETIQLSVEICVSFLCAKIYHFAGRRMDRIG